MKPAPEKTTPREHRPATAADVLGRDPKYKSVIAGPDRTLHCTDDLGGRSAATPNPDLLQAKPQPD